MSSPYRLGSALSVALLAYRISTANLSPITDCDEVYNYWEPLHFVLYGTGMQTWEYAPQFALRTYAYLLPLAGVANCFQCLLDGLPAPLIAQLSSLLLPTTSDATTSTAEGVLASGGNKPLLFALLRSFLALVSCCSELSFLNAIHAAIGPSVAHWTALCCLTAAGNFHAGGAYLPSATVAILWRLSAARQLREGHGWAIFWGLVAVLAVGWPFCAVLFVPTGFWALWQAGLGGCVRGKGRGAFQLKSVARVLLRTALQAAIVQTVVMAIDHHYYGRAVSPTWNIFMYNARSGGDELYGVEPFSYYAKNLLLNFNFVALLGILALPIILLRKTVARFYPRAFDGSGKSDGPEMLALVPMYLWMAVVFPRLHKEERFLFPIYPMLCLGAAISLREAIYLCNNLLSSLPAKKRRKAGPGDGNQLLLGLALLSPFAAISISRSMALYHHYSAPLQIYRDLFNHASAHASSMEGPITYVCTAGEWHRFPSSFFLPPNHQLGYLKSSFGGQLPQPFTEFGSKEESLGVQSGIFNDVNREEMDRYVDIGQCSYVIELVPSELSNEADVPECLQYMQSDDSAGSWKQVTSYAYLNAEATPALHRILYLPWGRAGKVTHKGYNLYVKER